MKQCIGFMIILMFSLLADGIMERFGMLGFAIAGVAAFAPAVALIEAGR